MNISVIDSWKKNWKIYKKNWIVLTSVFLLPEILFWVLNNIFKEPKLIALGVVSGTVFIIVIYKILSVLLSALFRIVEVKINMDALNGHKSKILDFL